MRQPASITDADRAYWAFQPLDNPPPPEVESKRPVHNEVDAFVIARLQASGLDLAPEASRGTLMRRVYFDLVGVPPSLAEMQSYLADEAEDAYERLVDRLLNDKRYGEKWARTWLDLTRYAESDGFNQDAQRPTAYLYRDWVIGALNADMPFDQFVLAQLAGDEIAPDDPQMLAATGFLRNWIYEYNQRDARTQWSNILNDITDVTGEVFLGLGVGCARCHDHKFDPILQKDYYRLQASFATFIPRDDRVYGTPAEIGDYRQRLRHWELATAEIRQQLDELEQPHKRSVAEKAYNKFPLDIRPILFRPAEERNGFEQQIADLADRQVILEWNKIEFEKVLKNDKLERWKALRDELKSLDNLKPQDLPTVLCAGEVTAAPPPVQIPSRESDGAIEPASFEVLGAQKLVSFVSTVKTEESSAGASGRRTALAQWINDPRNALPHRVVVNRAWQELFGTGLVRFVNDFGTLGEPPSHPELLDWLASWFLEHGRSRKELHRLLVTSSTYRQTSQPDENAATLRAGDVDWQNRLLWRFPARRLEAEQIRDAMLVATHSLQPSHGGPASDHDSFVRSIYTRVKRNQPHPFLVAFDAPDRSSSVGQRNVTTTANQALLLTNAEWPLGLASNLAQRLMSETSFPSQQVAMAYQVCLQREPTAAELRTGVAFLDQTMRHAMAIQPKDNRPSTGEAEAKGKKSKQAENEIENVELPWQSAAYQTALSDFCHVLLNSSEFLYIR
ncbi:MAG: DUF1549 and DUF1553 domain-containing protein [Pirellulaceae bacterium]